MKPFDSIHKGVILMVFISVVPFLNVFLVKKRYYKNESFGFSLSSSKSVQKLYGSIQDHKKRERLPKPKHSFP